MILSISALPALAAIGAVQVPEVPFELSNNHVFVRMTVSARPLWFILDTGAPNTLIDLATAEALGVALGDRIGAAGAGAATVTGALVKEGRAHLVGVAGVAVTLAAAIPLTAIGANEGRPVHGILGNDFIGQFVLGIDYQGRRLRLHDPATFRYTGFGTRIPITFVGYHPHVRADMVLADGGVVSADFVVDVGSGLPLALTSPLVAAHRLRERVGPTVRVPGTRGIGGAATADAGRVAALRIGTVELLQPVTLLFGDSAGVFTTAQFFQGNIGGDILRRFTAYFDYRRREMILEPNGARDRPFEFDMSGAQFTTDGDFSRIVVPHVAVGSPAAAAGLAAGDTVTAVDGRAVTAGVLGELREMLQREGTAVRLTVQRAGATFAVTLTPRRRV